MLYGSLCQCQCQCQPLANCKYNRTKFVQSTESKRRTINPYSRPVSKVLSVLPYKSLVSLRCPASPYACLSQEMDISHPFDISFFCLLALALAHVSPIHYASCIVHHNHTVPAILNSRISPRTSSTRLSKLPCAYCSLVSASKNCCTCAIRLYASAQNLN